MGGSPAGVAGASEGGGGGGGGGQMMGGAGGAADVDVCDIEPTAGQPGTLGTGGAGGLGGTFEDNGYYGGSGGGGGYYGGGGSGGGCVFPGAGGGGSSFGPVDAMFVSATNGGNGNVSITYTLPVPQLSTAVMDASTGQPWSGSEVTGGSAFDSATVAAVSGVAPTGTVTYTLYQDADCTGAVDSTQLVTLDSDGSVPDSSSTAGLAPGSYAYQASYSGDDNYAPATGACEPFAVAQASQVIAFTSSPPSPAVFGGGYAPTATGGASGNPLLFSIDSSSGPGVCSLNSAGTTVSFTGAGTCVVDANQAGDSDYRAAPEQQQSFTVARASQAIVFTSSPPSPAVFGGGYAPTATGGASGIAVLSSIDASSDAGVCSLNAAGTTVSFTGAGTCVIEFRVTPSARRPAPMRASTLSSRQRCPRHCARARATSFLHGRPGRC